MESPTASANRTTVFLSFVEAIATRPDSGIPRPAISEDFWATQSSSDGADVHGSKARDFPEVSFHSCESGATWRRDRAEEDELEINSSSE